MPVPETVVAELASIERSPEFARAGRLFRFLNYIVRQTLAGNEDSLKESVLGVEVFGRPTGYDSRADPIVRTEARRLRSRLEEYYSRQEAANIRIVVPTGGYVPVFEEIGHAPPAPQQVTAPEISEPRFSFAASLVRIASRWRSITIVAAAGIVILAAPGFLFQRRGDDTLPAGTSAIYLQSVQHLFTNNPQRLEQAASGLAQVIRAAPRFAPAYASLAQIRLDQAKFHYAPGIEALPEARREAERALSLDPHNLDASLVIAAVSRDLDWNWKDAEDRTRRALAASGEHPRALFYYANLLADRGDLAAALGSVRKGLQKVRASEGGHLLLARLLYYQRDYAAALTALRETPRVNPDTIEPDLLEAMIDRMANASTGNAQLADAVRLVGTQPELQAVHLWFVIVRFPGDALSELEPLLQTCERTGVPSVAVARVFCGLGNFEKTFYWLERAMSVRDPDLAALAVDPSFDAVRDDPRFSEILTRVGLPDIRVAYGSTRNSIFDPSAPPK